MRVALFGAGRIGQLHGRLLAEQPEVSELVISDPDAERARQAANATGGTVAPTVDAAFDGAEAVVVAATTSAHASLTRAAVDRGIPVFCEKPLALDLDETVRLVDDIARTNVPVQVGFMRRFDPTYIDARRLLRSGELGTLYLVRLISHDHEPPPDGYIPTSGGLFRDSSIHDFDALRWLTGREVHEVYAVGSVRGFPIFAESGDADTAAAILRLDDGTLGVLSQTRHNPRGYDVRMELVGSRDAVAVGLTQKTPLRTLDDGLIGSEAAWDSFLDRFETAYRAELLAFLRVARGEIPSPCTPRDGLEAMRISVAATRSRADGRPVSVSEVGQPAPAG